MKIPEPKYKELLSTRIQKYTICDDTEWILRENMISTYFQISVEELSKKIKQYNGRINSISGIIEFFRKDDIEKFIVEILEPIYIMNQLQK